jgi:hypothetical protein
VLRFSFGRERLSDDELRTALFGAVASGDTRKVESLVSQHKKRVTALFPSWTSLPRDVRSDLVRTRWWVDGALGVAQAAARFGNHSMMALLVGPPGDNIIISWQNALRSALTHSRSGNQLIAIHLLEDMLEQTKGLTGSAVDDLLPKVYGLLGTAYYLAGKRHRGRTYTVKAKKYCERIGDVEGVEVYSTHLCNVDAAILGNQKRSEQRHVPSAAEHRLSPELLAKVIRSGDEYGWRFEDLPSVLAEARSLGVAVRGGQVQFKLPDGTCELYWQNADASPRRDGETSNSYVERSHDEVRAALKRLPNPTALVTEGIEQFSFLKRRTAEGVALSLFLCFVCYLDAE